MRRGAGLVSSVCELVDQAVRDLRDDGEVWVHQIAHPQLACHAEQLVGFERVHARLFGDPSDQLLGRDPRRVLGGRAQPTAIRWVAFSMRGQPIERPLRTSNRSVTRAAISAATPVSSPSPCKAWASPTKNRAPGL